ncbi:crumbs 1-like protein [Anopheles sinensis]|uniref:Crumbs 1-like protein n=1 Tax=Anopheles sinensis TaxID=74873 RepID=A0A084WMS1_ANOSI|nr:crumbs 1-like protein [Anopheles sinensis]
MMNGRAIAVRAQKPCASRGRYRSVRLQTSCKGHRGHRGARILRGRGQPYDADDADDDTGLKLPYVMTRLA